MSRATMSSLQTQAPVTGSQPPRWWRRIMKRARAVGALGRWRGKHRLGNIHEVSQVVRADLDRANAVLERIFLDLSRHFEPLAGRMQGLVESSGSLRTLASGQEGGQTLFQRAIGVLHSPLEFIDRCAAQHGRLLELLRRCEEEMSIMLRFQLQMNDLLAPLSFVEVLFRVESASLEMEQRETFGTVAADINHLRQLVDEAFQKNAGLLRGTHDTLAGVRQRLERDFQLHARIIAEKRQRIEGAIGRLDNQLERNAHQKNDVHTLTRNLATRVSSIVEALQYQDIIKQKCSHVVDALVDWEQHCVYDEAFVQLQSAQLESVDGDIDKAARRVSEDIEEIRALGEAVEKRAVCMDDLEGMIASADGMVQMLLDSLRETRAILGSTTSVIAEASEAARPAGNIAANLTSTLGELSINMRLVALNAQVRSVQITDVTGLEVLAVRTAEISNKITGVAKEVSVRLGRLREVTDEMFGLFDRFSTEGLEKQGQMDETQGAVEKELHGLRDRTLEVFQSIGQTLEEVRSASGGLQKTLDGLPTAHDAVRKARKDLALFAQNHCSADSQLSAPGAALVSAQVGKYTMEAERRIHATMTGGAESVGAGGDSVEPVAPELFVDPGSRRSGSQLTAVASASPSRKSPEAAPTSAALGENVDLF